MKIIVINGPNLNMLGKRDADHYGSLSLDSIQGILEKEFPDISFEFFQSNLEGEIIDKIQPADKKYNGILINPGGYAHTSVAIRDALAECKIPKIEVHLSHLANREEFRQKLITASGCSGYISGFKEKSYLAGVYLLKKLIEEEGL
jgi:3-dehydroquinate dehydratase II